LKTYSSDYSPDSPLDYPATLPSDYPNDYLLLFSRFLHDFILWSNCNYNIVCSICKGKMHLQTCRNNKSANHKKWAAIRKVSHLRKVRKFNKLLNLANSRICNLRNLFADCPPLSDWHLQGLRIHIHLYGFESWIRIRLRTLRYRMPQFLQKILKTIFEFA
jgi:hypothetical protein